MTHALTTNGALGYLNTASLTNNALEANALVLSTRAFPVLGWTEDLLAEKAVLFRLEGSVVDGLRLLNLTRGPGTNILAGSEANAKGAEVFYSCCHCLFLLVLLVGGEVGFGGKLLVAA